MSLLEVSVAGPAAPPRYNSGMGLPFRSTFIASVLGCCLALGSDTTSTTPRWLKLSPDGRVLVQSASDVLSVPLEKLRHVRFDGSPLPSMQSRLSHRVLLSDEQIISGELHLLDTTSVLLDTAWARDVCLSRDAVQSIRQLEHWQTVIDDDFSGWTLSPGTRRIPQQAGSESSLSLNGITSARRRFPLVTADDVPILLTVDVLSSQNWDQGSLSLEAEFARPNNAAVVGIHMNSQGFQTQIPLSSTVTERINRQPGTHCLRLEAGPSSFSVSVNDKLLGFNRSQGVGSQLQALRIAITSPVATLSIQRLTVARSIRDTSPRSADPTQDEIWLDGGDQLLCVIKHADARSVALEGRFGTRTLPWASLRRGIRGLTLRQQLRQCQETTGEHVRAWFQAGATSELDQLIGTIKAIEPDHVVLSHRDLGDVVIPRASLRQLRWLFHGRRIALDLANRHLGPHGQELAGILPARAEGHVQRVPFVLHELPQEARLTFQIVRQAGDSRLSIRVNGHEVDTLSITGSNPDAGYPVKLAVPRGILHKGDNEVNFSMVPASANSQPGHVVVSSVVLELPR